MPPPHLPNALLRLVMSYRVYHLAELLPDAVAHLTQDRPDVPPASPPRPAAALHARLAEAAYGSSRSRTDTIRLRDAPTPRP